MPQLNRVPLGMMSDIRGVIHPIVLAVQGTAMLGIVVKEAHDSRDLRVTVTAGTVLLLRLPVRGREENETTITTGELMVS